MFIESLRTKAKDIYREEGLLTLLKRSWWFAKKKIYSAFASGIEFGHKFASSRMKEISLNGVTVPVEVYPIDRYIPFYELPYPTEDDPLYEQTEVESLRTYASEGDDVVVIGGGFGATAVVARRVTDGTITVFEPNANRFEILKRAVEANDSGSNINLRHAIVSDINSSIVESKTETDPEYVSPEELPMADVFEIDCEGAETAILKQMKVSPSVILVETHNNHDEVAQILRDIGYDIVDVVEDGVEQHPNCTHIRARLA